MTSLRRTPTLKFFDYWCISSDEADEVKGRVKKTQSLITGSELEVSISVVEGPPYQRMLISPVTMTVLQ